MDNPNLVFALAYTYWDAPPESGVEAVMLPSLYAFADAALAASSNEGLSIVEGDLSFFAADGSPLEAAFSQQPYVDTERLKYFAGKYSLQAGRGESLRKVISDEFSYIPPQCAKIIMQVATSDDAAREHGWTNVETMRTSIDQALAVALPGTAKLIDFEWPIVWAAEENKQEEK